MAKIIIGFSTSSEIISRFVRFMTKAPMSHAYIKIPVPEHNTNVIFHADATTVHYTNYDYFLSLNQVIEELEVEVSEERAKLAELLRVTECGKPYSKIKLVGFFWIMFLRLFRIKTHNPFHDDGKSSYICVELISKSLGIQDKTTLTPVDLYNILKSGKLSY